MDIPGCDDGSGDRTTVGRRSFLTQAGAALAVAAGAPLSFGLASRVVSAQSETPPGRLVSVFLRGGIDGLSAVVPYQESNYYDSRPDISIAPGEVLDLDGRFGLHPAMAALLPLFEDGRLGVVHAAGNPAASRSHFDAQDFMEQGDDERVLDGYGWLGRHLDRTTTGSDSVFRAVGLSANPPGSLRGYPALVMSGVAGFGLGGASGMTADLDPSLRSLYLGLEAVERTGSGALDAVEAVQGLEPSNVGGGGPVGRAFSDAASLLGAGLGVEVVTIDIGGWDTHTNMGDASGGQMQTKLEDLAGWLADFQQELDASGQDDVTTVVMSEFGRRVSQNGNGGTDHGWGNVMFALGTPVNGGQVLADWPGLAPGDLAAGDLAATTDYRNVLGDLCVAVLGNDDVAGVFPDHDYTPVGVI